MVAFITTVASRTVETVKTAPNDPELLVAPVMEDWPFEKVPL
jgi:hypothetical protein